MSGKTFQFHMQAEGFKSFADDLRQLKAAGGEAAAAIEKLERSSPQLAAAIDGAGQKAEQAARRLKELPAGANESARAFEAAGRASSSFSERLGGITTRGGGVAAVVAAIGAGVAAAAEAIAKAGDQYTSTMQRLQAATGSLGAASQVYQSLFRLSQQTGVSVAESAGAFARFTVAAKEIGATNEEVLKLVAGIQKAGIVAGTSTQESNAAVQQLGQALASGVLQGDELRSILENMPQLAQAMAQQLGVGIGQLRQMGAEGKLTADIVMPALLKATEGINKQFDAMPPTMARAKEILAASAEDFAARLDGIVHRSERFARFMLMGAAALQEAGRTIAPTPREAAERGAAQARQEIEALERLRDANVGSSRHEDTPGSGVLRGATPGFDPARLEEAKRRLSRFQIELREMNNDAQTQSAEDEDRAQARRLSAQRLADDKKVAAMRESLDQRYKIETEYQKRLREIDQLSADGKTPSVDVEHLRALATKEHDEALKNLANSGHQAAAANTELADALAKLNRQIVSDANSVRDALDPQAKALDTYKKQIEALDRALDHYYRTRDAGGDLTGLMTPEEIERLRGKADEGLLNATKKLEKGANDTGRAFDQFFSRAASGFEDAIVKGKSFGDVMQGLEQDIARLILRLTILDPLSKSLSGLFSGSGSNSRSVSSSIGGSGGIGEFLSDALVWIGSFFADGGIMTGQGPVPLRRYAAGGIANSPQLAMFGEGSTPEAYVPLPDGRAIDVNLRGNAGGGATVHSTINVHVANSNASPQQIAAMAEMAADRANRRLVEQINRGGGLAKAVGRRR